MELIIQNTISNLIKKGFDAYYLEKKEEVVPFVEKILKKGCSVSHGGSETLKEVNLINLFKSGKYDYICRDGLSGEDLRNCYIKAFGCDAFFTSSNAVTEKGELYNVDGASNRVSMIAFGPREVFVIVGINKIVKNIDEAILRVKTIASPKNCVRLNIDTPCNKIGKCISLEKEKPLICDGCFTQKRICCNYLITAQSRIEKRIKVIIVNEKLGY